MYLQQDVCYYFEKYLIVFAAWCKSPAGKCLMQCAAGVCSIIRVGPWAGSGAVILPLAAELYPDIGHVCDTVTTLVEWDLVTT